MAVVIRKFSSHSSDAEYTAQFDPETGESSCTCPGWRFKRGNQPRGCKHTKLLEAGQAELPKPEPVQPSVDVPAFVEPMLAHPKEREQPLSAFADGWDLEEKMNGRRLISCVGTNALVTWSRPGAGKAPLQTSVPPHVKEALRQLPPGVYDGEIYVPGGKAWDAARLDKRHEKQVVLWDVMFLVDRSTTGLPLTERRKLLAMAVRHIKVADAGIVMPAVTYPVSKAVVDAIWADGREGAMLKRVDGLYHPGRRSWDWQKVKRYLPERMTIVGFEAALSGPYSVLLLRADDGHDAKVKNQTRDQPERFRRDQKLLLGQRLWVEHQGRTPNGSFMHCMYDHLDLED